MNAYCFIAFILFATSYAETTYERLMQSSVDLVMPQASITASSTCGMNGPERFCEMVHHSNENEPLCKICDNRVPAQRHPIEYAKSEDDNKWWQSSTLAEGEQNQFVNVTIDLKQVYQIVYMILKMGHSPRPANWILERSIDGVKFEPWIFFAQDPYECKDLMEKFGMEVKITMSPKPAILEDDEVFCTTHYSETGILMKSGEIILSLVNGRRSFENMANFQTRSVPTKFINFLSARYIRMRFLKLMTLGGEHMGLPGYREKSIYNRYFYSLKNIEIGGKCICNNHALTCNKYTHGKNRFPVCQCQHNTCGNNCERCCPMYNQKPWKPGAVCEECQCNNKAESCTYNQTIATLQLSMNKLGQMDGGGICKDCKMNTAGINCDKCIPGYYRPSQISPKRDYPCQKCNCHPTRSYGTCVTDGDEIKNQKPGDCHCKPNYKPPDCRECSLGYKRINSEFCDKCTCNLDGSVESPALYRCEHPCNCKVNVDPSSYCTRCKAGFFNLDKRNPEGCQPCFCFGITTNCGSLKAEILKLYDLSNWKVTKLEASELKLKPKTSPLNYPYVEDATADSFLKNPTTYFFEAPSVYLGNWLTSFKTLMLFVVKIDVDVNNPGSQIDSPDVYLECNKKRFYYKVNINDERLHRKVMVRLEPMYWKLENNIMPPSLADFMSCFVNVERFLIKAKYYSNQKKISLLNVTLDRASPLTAIHGKMPYVEKCMCPTGYAGLSCESCAPGYRRYKNQLVQGICKKCDCNNHSDECDADTGHCKNCQHNTIGPFCNQCKQGYYGSAKSGKENACQKCKCPRIDYQMTDQCTAVTGDNYSCDNCAQNTAGRFCERCAPGYYGEPIRKVECKKCRCNNNEESCDSVTGVCKCKVLIKGEFCELCADGYWGNALNSTGCKVCKCDKTGSLTQFCNGKTGQCRCKNNFVGRNCDQCKSGMYRENDQCVPCQCHPDGVQIDHITKLPNCNSTTGACLCKPGYSSSANVTNCDRCAANFFGFPACQDCRCSKKSKSEQCDEKTGVCECGSNVIDTKCTRCKENYFWSNKSDCEPCKCGLGALSKICDMQNGQCLCVDNVIGRDCDKCKVGYYGLTRLGCTKCQVCGVGKICNSVNGACECPPNTEGVQCENCALNTWGYDATKGCKKCQCSMEGSKSLSCNLKTGTCVCKENFSGDKCDQCASGFFGYPNCTKCLCDDSGVVKGYEKKCDIVTGQCKCKENVEGIKCDTCKSGKFGLNKNYPGGCFSCFCSNQAKNCTKASGLRLIRAESMRYNIMNSDVGIKLNTNYKTVVLDNLVMNISWPTKMYSPLYADLTKFLPSSDLTMFYGSELLGFTLSCDNSFKKCGPKTNGYQTVFLLESFDGQYEIGYKMNFTDQLTKDYIRVKIPIGVNFKNGEWVLIKSDNRTLDTPLRFDNVTLLPLNTWRDLMMTILLNVTKIRVNLYSKDVNPDFIKFSVFFNKVTSLDLPLSKSIESIENCTCDSVATGLNCQNPTKGFYREIKIKKTVNFTVIVDLTPPVVKIEPCNCNGHSTTCDDKTGVCSNCSGFTRGPYCDICAIGYFGDPTKGPCTRCPCPNKITNNALTCVLDNKKGLICLCSSGYQGKLCDECTEGYYRDPKTTEVNCLPCNCNKQGSTSQNCNRISGKCQCVSGVSGQKCDQCSQDYVLTNKTCKNCRQGCTKKLFEKMDKIEKNISDAAILPIKKSLMEKVNTTLETARDSLEIMDKYNDIKKNMSEIKLQNEKDRKEFQNKMKELDKYKMKILSKKQKIESFIEVLNATKDDGNSDGKVKVQNLTNVIEKNIRINTKTINESELYEVMQRYDKLIEYLKNNRKLKLKLEENLLEKFENYILQWDIAKKILYNGRKSIKKYENFLKFQKDVNEEAEKQLMKLENMKNQMKDSKEKLKQLFEEMKENIKNLENLTNVLYLNYTIWKEEIKKSSNSKIPEGLEKKVALRIQAYKDTISKFKKGSVNMTKVDTAKKLYEDIPKQILKIKEELKSIQLEASKCSDLDDKTNKLTNSYKELIKFFGKEIKDFKSKIDQLSEKQAKITEYTNNLKSISEGKPIESLKTEVNDGLALNFVEIVSLNKKLDDIGLSKLTPIKKPSLNLTNIKKSLAEMKASKERIKKKLNDSKDLLKKIKEYMKNQRHLFELSHGSASLTPEPVRISTKCIRKYVTYYLSPNFDFNLKLFLKPEFILKSLVLFGYDASKKPIHTFAITMDNKGLLNFMWETGNGKYKTLSLNETISMNQYSQLSIESQNNIWFISLKELKGGIRSQFVDREINDNLRVSSQTTVFIGGLPTDLDFLGNEDVKKTSLYQKLSQEYSISYQGCMRQVQLQSMKFGLSDTRNTVNCDYKPDITSYTFLKKFSCRADNNTTSDKSLETMVRTKRAENTKKPYSQFTGNGYIKSVPSQNPFCTRDSQNSIKLIVEPYQTSTSTNFLMAYYCKKKETGLVVAEKEGKFLVAYWIKDDLYPLKTVKGKTIKDGFKWLLQGKSKIIDGVGGDIDGFRTEDVCDKDSYFYLGSIPETDTEFYNKVKRYAIDISRSFSGELFLTTLRDGNNFMYFSATTRFIRHKNVDPSQSYQFPVYSLHIKPAMAEFVSIKNFDNKELVGGFSTMILLEGDLTTTPQTLMTFKFNNGEYQLQISSEYISINGLSKLKLARGNQKHHYIRLIFTNGIFFAVDDKYTGKLSDGKSSALVESIKLFGLTVPYYIYSTQIGNELLNYASPSIEFPPAKDVVNYYFPPGSLLPLEINWDTISNPGKPTDSSNKEVKVPDYQSDQASNIVLLKTQKSSLIDARKYTTDKHTSDFKNSALFSVPSTGFGTLTQEIIEKHWKSTGTNEISLMLKTQPENQAKLIMDLIFKNQISLSFIKPANKNVLVLLLRMNGKQIRSNEIPLFLSYEKWNSLKIYGNSNNKELFIEVQGSKFSFHEVLEMSLPTGIQIGGYAGDQWTFRNQNNEDEAVGYFSGCIDDFKINGNIVNLLNSFPKSNSNQQCPRVFKLVSNGGQILFNYEKATQPRDAIGLIMSDMRRRKTSEFEVRFKIQFTGLEKGVIIMTGNEESFCYMEIDPFTSADKKSKANLYLKFKSKTNRIINPIKVEVSGEGWLNIGLKLFLSRAKSLELIKFNLNDHDSEKMDLSNVFSETFVPEFYFGYKPELIPILTQKELQYRQNFVGCISNLECKYNQEKLSKCAIEGSDKYISKDICTVDKKTYLMKMMIK